MREVSQTGDNSIFACGECEVYDQIHIAGGDRYMRIERGNDGL